VALETLGDSGDLGHNDLVGIGEIYLSRDLFEPGSQSWRFVREVLEVPPAKASVQGRN
jgi:hypothetical protein